MNLSLRAFASSSPWEPHRASLPYLGAVVRSAPNHLYSFFKYVYPLEGKPTRNGVGAMNRFLQSASLLALTLLGLEARAETPFGILSKRSTAAPMR